MNTASARPSSAATGRPGSTAYSRFLVVVAGMGGLLYGIDIGIIAAALLYLSKTIDLSIGQTSFIVAAVLGGSMISSPVTGMLADWLGRKKIMILGGAMFVVSVALIVSSQGFIPLFVGRLLQGMSGGVIAVVVPLYLAESLSAESRGRGTAVFQFMLTFGIVLAAFIGWFYTQQAEAAITLAAGRPALILAAQNHAWRGMFQAVIYPGLVFFGGVFVLSESPRWLLRRGKPVQALQALRRSASEQEAELTLREMLEQDRSKAGKSGSRDSSSLWRWKYAAPFLLACGILALTQATGINSILSYLVMILKQAGMSATRATQCDVAVKILCSAMTLVAVLLVDRKGRRFLLMMGTAGIVFSLAACALLFLNIESSGIDATRELRAAQKGSVLTLPVGDAAARSGSAGHPMALTVLYSYGNGSHIQTVLSNSESPVLAIAPGAEDANKPLVIGRAFYSPIPDKKIGGAMAICLALFIAFYAMGPGVVVWLVLSELMPTRIRSTGMGIALLLNQGVSTLSAAVFLPIVGNHGYSLMFLGWAGCTVLYLAVAAFLLPETKGKTLEEIEMLFERPGQ